jgi:hypothetical protein
MHWPLAVLVPLGLAAPISASTIVTVVCATANGIYQTQSSPSTASCDAVETYPVYNEANATGMVSAGSMSGYAGAAPNGEDYSSVASSFDIAFAVPTVLSWDYSANESGEYAYTTETFLGETIGCQGALMSQCNDTGVAVLSPGDYTFSMSVYDSEEGSAGGSFSISTTPETPEPGTVGLVASALLACLGRSYLLPGRRLTG